MNQVVDNMLEISLRRPEDFLIIKETLTRIGIATKDKKLYQSCHILHKQGRYFIVHFKELFALDGKASNILEEDLSRRNRIASLIQEWGLAKILHPGRFTDLCPMSLVKVISSKEKGDWELIPKYNIGNKKKVSS